MVNREATDDEIARAEGCDGVAQIAAANLDASVVCEAGAEFKVLSTVALAWAVKRRR